MINKSSMRMIDENDNKKIESEKWSENAENQVKSDMLFC